MTGLVIGITVAACCTTAMSFLLGIGVGIWCM